MHSAHLIHWNESISSRVLLFAICVRSRLLPLNWYCQIDGIQFTISDEAPSLPLISFVSMQFFFLFIWPFLILVNSFFREFNTMQFKILMKLHLHSDYSMQQIQWKYWMNCNLFMVSCSCSTVWIIWHFEEIKFCYHIANESSFIIFQVGPIFSSNHFANESQFIRLSVGVNQENKMYAKDAGRERERKKSQN